MLKAVSNILASRHSAAKRHSWTGQDGKQYSLASSNHSFQGMTPQVKAGGQAPFGNVWIAFVNSSHSVLLFLFCLQILAVSHLSEIVQSGYRQTLAASLALQPCRNCKPSIPTSPVWVPTVVVVFFCQIERGFAISVLWLHNWFPFVHL